MLLQTVRPNIVQAIRAYRVEDLMQAAQEAGQHFLYANLSEAQSKQDVLDGIAQAFLFPAHFGKNLDASHTVQLALKENRLAKGFEVVDGELAGGLERRSSGRGLDGHRPERVIAV